MGTHINSWYDLQHYGINSLTGEACAYGMRQLVDLNADGADLLAGFLGLPLHTREKPVFSPPWNSSVNGKPTVASVMLARDLLPSLSRYILFHVEKCDCVVEKGGSGGVVGHTMQELAEYHHTPESVGVLYNGAVYRNFSSRVASVDGRNIHQFSGRTT